MPGENCWQRLKKRSDFQRVQKQGQAVKMPALVFLCAPSATNDARLGFTATKRTVGNAVQRNRAKRRMRGLFEAVLKNATPPQKDPLDCVMIARKYILERDFGKMAQELQTALEKEGFTFDEKNTR